MGRPFQPGQSGNPKGRPAGSRNKLSEAFIEALAADFEEHGAAVIARVRDEKPDQYLKVVASIIPKDLNVNVNQYDDWSDDELQAAMRMIDEALRAAREQEGLSDDDEGEEVSEVRH